MNDYEARDAISALYQWARQLSVRQAATEELLRKNPNFTEADWKQAEDEAGRRVVEGAHPLDSWDSLATHLKGLTGI